MKFFAPEDHKFNFLNFIIMKLYGIKMDKNENGEEVALIELTRAEVKHLMDFANEAVLYNFEKEHETSREIASRFWMKLYDIKYSKLWKE